MTIVGELTAGTADKKAKTDSCRTCSATDQKLSPGGFCWDPNACAQRRIARVRGGQNLRFPCVVKIVRHRAVYYVREFGPKILPPPNPLPKGFTLKDYEPNPSHVYYEAVMEPGNATSFKPAHALALAKEFNGTVMNRP